ATGRRSSTPGSTPTSKSWSTGNTSFNPAPRSGSCTARRPRKPLHKARSRRRSREHFRAVHPAADRDRSADAWVVGGGSGRLAAVAGGGAADRQLSDPYRHGAAAGRRPADHGIHGGIAARI